MALATPLWWEQKAIKAIYQEACMLTAETGIKHEVDHIVPIMGQKVCLKSRALLLVYGQNATSFPEYR